MNGGEHLGNMARELSDKRKMEICKDNGIKIVLIPNSFVKIYEYVADIIMVSKNEKSTIQNLLFDE